MYVQLKSLILVQGGCVLLKFLRNRQNGEKKGLFSLMDNFERLRKAKTEKPCPFLTQGLKKIFTL
jgi:hypothetical protein